jgi:hypothetical protein
MAKVLIRKILFLICLLLLKDVFGDKGEKDVFGDDANNLEGEPRTDTNTHRLKEPTTAIYLTVKSSISLSLSHTVLIDSQTSIDAKRLLNYVLPEISDIFEYKEMDISSHVLLPSSYSNSSSLITYSLSKDWQNNTGKAIAETCSTHYNESFHIHVICNGLLGLAYSLHNLREKIALNGLEYLFINLISKNESSFFSSTPAFGVRAWSEEGTLLAIPDRGYYTSDGNSADIDIISNEALSLEIEIIPAMLRLRMNTLIVLNSDIEDYITYDTLPIYLPNAPVIYSLNDTHRNRRSGILSVITPWVKHLLDDFGISFFLQVYELSSPPGVCSSASSNGPPPLFNCSLDSPAVTALVQTKYTELFSAIPAMAGIFVTVEDSWTPRAGYVFNVLWSTQAELPRVVNMFHNAIVGLSQKQLYFRLWVFGETVDWNNLVTNTPTDVRFSVKQTQGDFLLDYDINALLKCINGSDQILPSSFNTSLCPPHDRRLIIEVDAFRQYNGWTSGIAYMGSQWSPRLTEAINNANGTEIDIWGWGSWAPGCTWPDSGPTLINGTNTTYKSWRSWWSTYRLFNGTETNGGFSLGGQANAYLLYRLSWDKQPTNETQIALDFGTLFFGEENAIPIARILNASFYAWLPTSSPIGLGDFTLFWTMMQHDVGTFSSLSTKFSLLDFDKASNLSFVAINEMENALSLIDPTKIPISFPNAYTGAVRAISLTRHYLSAYFSWRAAGLSVAQLGSKPIASQCIDSYERIDLLNQTASTFGILFPIEGAQWVVSSLDESLYSHPPFLTSTERTMLLFVNRWMNQTSSVC